jgi:hypothetical protein
MASTASTATSADNTQSAIKARRKSKDLPLCLAYLTEANFQTQIKARLETDNKDQSGEVMVAYEFKLEGDDEATIEISSLNLDQIRKLCKNVGLQYINKCSKFQCRKALWVLAKYQQGRERDSIAYSTVSDKMTNNIIRLTNIIFSHEFFDSFITLNDNKTRVDHETHDLPKDFWEDITEAMNGSDDDDVTPLLIVLSPDDSHYDEVEALNLRVYDIMTSAAIKKKVMVLLKVRREIQKNMTTSGEHDSDPYNFVEIAMKKILGGKGGLTLLGIYYFFKLCDAHPEVDVRYTVDIDDALRGNTDDSTSTKSSDDDVVPNDAGGGKNKSLNQEKKRAYSAMSDLSDVAKNIAAEMHQTNILAERTTQLAERTTQVAENTAKAIEEKNRLSQQAQLIALAQHLGRNEILETILQSIAPAPSSSSG